MASTAASIDVLTGLPRKTKLARMATMARREPGGVVGLVIISSLVFIAVFANQIAPYDPIATEGRNRLLGLSAAHIFGTDEQGRDVFSRIVFGTRAAMAISTTAVVISTACALFIGMTSAYIGGLYDLILQRFMDAFQVLPGLIIALAILSVFPRNYVSLTIVLAILFIAGPARVIRGATIAIKENQYVESAHAIGSGTPRIILLHILPNIMPVLIVSFSVYIGAAILVEASLSFLGYGIPPPNPTWGIMLNTGARQYMQYQPTMAIFPGVFITLTVLGFNMIGDAVRDLFDPYLRGRA